jgi:hypothetical protein
MRETIIFLGIWFIFLFLSLVFLSKRIAFLSMVPIFCAIISYFTSNRTFLVCSFLILFLIYFLVSKPLTKGENL